MASSNQQLCERLLAADTEAAVVAALDDAGYWSNDAAWRYLGDIENNWSSIGNQQSEAVAALTEKIINGVDARLMDACLTTGIDPESNAAPKSIEDAVARFQGAGIPHGGRISAWADDKLTLEGRLLTVAATGNMPSEGMPSISIADQGEGQEPDRFPDTWMSLGRSNKLRVHFVQGKFNMGGTGALQFCGDKHKFQLVISRRDPALVPTSAAARSREWGFTIVRREWPEGGRSSVFTYLAPVNCAQQLRAGDVLSFPADSFPIFPEANDDTRAAYVRHAPYGSLVKLYEYQSEGYRSNIVSAGGGLLRRLDLGLPELALPVRVFECRSGYRGHSGSFATNLLGLSARLQQNKGANLESGFPVNNILNLRGHQVKVSVYAFRPTKASEYRTARNGVVFSVNGQAHGSFPIDFFRRSSVGMSYLADTLLVLVDCSAIDGQMRETLFMNSRDRLRDTSLARSLEAEIEQLLKADEALRSLRNSRRAAELTEKLSESKPLTDVLQDILKNSPSLAKMFLQGLKLSSPFPPASGSGEGTSGEFHGKTYPTFYRFRRRAQDDVLVRHAPPGSRVRIPLETDADDEYFARDFDPGTGRLLHRSGDDWADVEDWMLRGPRSGASSLILSALPEWAEVGTELDYRLEITDPSRIDAFTNCFTVRVLEATTVGGRDSRTADPTNSGKGSTGGPSSLQLPNIVEVPESQWESRGFDENTALKVKNASDADEDSMISEDVYDFYVNVDNKYLKIGEKESRDNPALLRAKFTYGLVLLGLALLQEVRTPLPSGSGVSDDRELVGTIDVEQLVERASRAIAPVLLPMLDSIGGLEMEDN